MAGRQRLQSNPSPKCPKCKKPVNRDNDAIDCEKCEKWYHGTCCSLSEEDVQWLGERRNCLWVCNLCLDGSLFTSEAKFDSLLHNINDCLKNNIPEIIKSTFEEEILKNTLSSQMKSNIENVMDEGIKSYPDALAAEPKPKEFFPKQNRSCDSDLQFIITGVPEKGETHYERINSDVSSVEKIVSFIGVNHSGKITSLRRLGKSLPKGSNECRKCRPIIVTSSNPLFMETCFARSHKLQNYDDPVYIKKLLSPDDRALEKKILAKRYDMIANQGKDKSQFEIKKLQLFYQGEKVEVESA